MFSKNHLETAKIQSLFFRFAQGLGVGGPLAIFFRPSQFEPLITEIRMQTKTTKTQQMAFPKTFIAKP